MSDTRLIPISAEQVERFEHYAAVAQATGIAQFRDDLRSIVTAYQDGITEEEGQSAVDHIEVLNREPIDEAATVLDKLRSAFPQDNS